MIAEVDASVFVLDFVPNASVEQMKERMETFYRIIRSKHPDTPVIFIEDPIFTHTLYDERIAKEVQRKNDTLKEITITPLDEQFIEKAIKIVEERMSDSDFSVEMLGAELGLSRSHLYKKLMCITGKGPAEFIRIIRLKRSKQLLKESQKQIAEIAYEVGFSSPKRFTVNFKNEFGISPSDYIRSLK